MKYTKTRTNYKVGTGFYPYSTPAGGTWTLGKFLESGYQRASTETISYNCGGKFNTCNHTERTVDVGYPASASCLEMARISYHGGDPETDPEFWYENSMPCMQYPSGTVRLDYDAGDLAKARYDAYSRLIHLDPPQFMNVLQSACELKDTKQTVTGVLDFIKWGRSFLGRAGRRIGGRYLTLASNLSAVASAYLTYAFGIKPTASDVKRFLREISQGKLRVKGRKPHVVAKKGEVMVVRYRSGPKHKAILAAMYPDAPSGVKRGEGEVRIMRGRSTIRAYDGGMPWRLPQPKTVLTTSVVGCYFAEVIEDVVLTDIEDLKRQWEWNCPSFGTVWELIPFSFLVDWAVGVGDFIRSLERRHCTQNWRKSLGPIWISEETRSDVYRPSLSSLNMRVNGFSRPTDFSYGGSLNLSVEFQGDAHLAERSSSYYRSPVTTPNVIWPQLAKSIKSYQISTGMALFTQFASKR